MKFTRGRSVLLIACAVAVVAGATAWVRTWPYWSVEFANRDGVRGLAIAANNTVWAMFSDGDIGVLSLDDGSLVATIALADPAQVIVPISHGNQMAVGCLSGRVVVFDCVSRERVAEFDCEPGPCIALAADPNGQLLFAASRNDPRIFVIDLAAKVQRAVSCIEDGQYVRALCVLPGDQPRVIAAMQTGGIHILSGPDLRPTGTIRGSEAFVERLQPMDAESFISLGNPAIVRVWDVAKRKAVASLQLPHYEYLVLDVAYCQERRQAVIATSHGRLYTWDCRDSVPTWSRRLYVGSQMSQLVCATPFAVVTGNQKDDFSSNEITAQIIKLSLR